MNNFQALLEGYFPSDTKSHKDNADYHHKNALRASEIADKDDKPEAHLAAAKAHFAAFSAHKDARETASEDDKGKHFLSMGKHTRKMKEHLTKAGVPAEEQAEYFTK